ncbi:delta-lactam-biosynthetic de-N-acetylase [Clostridium sp. 19966]|uniref:delta-lactam-biosynthetic de-N-acetylase n=1 Tax=Clostridium sp. 19966 TaxID=2768166 RepID=UPI0028DE4071|nr:delta-lactam-biosynthetic de-N-acetylase [Clostridium sp. 19966]MDT8716507.1 delta-lactam-biosynthetic de-N-acetylase [Clostridium sp. 19966]
MKKNYLLKHIILIFLILSTCFSSVSANTKSIEASKTEQEDNVPFYIQDYLECEKDCREKLEEDKKKDYTLSTKEKSWFIVPNNKGLVPSQKDDVNELLRKYSGYYVGDTNKKELYITFDEGYENGYTNKILDILKRHDVKAAFFVVKPYITSNPDIIKRMDAEDHLVCNHSSHHPSMAKVKNFDKFNKELEDVEKAYEEVTSKTMPKFFRPPMGKYSDLSISYTQDLGYKTVFWSFAYFDWDVKKQPSHEEAMKKILTRTHNGAIILLHAVSKTNADILDELLTKWKDEGYSFKTLNDLK